MTQKGSIGVLAVIAAGACIPLFAQERPTTITGAGKMGGITLFDNTQAKEIAQLVDTGGVDLGEAITIAEREGKGKALQAFARMHAGPMIGGPGDKDTGNMPGQDRNKPATTTADKHLAFEVVVFANNQLVTYHVDGKNRQAKQVGTRVDLTKDRP